MEDHWLVKIVRDGRLPKWWKDCWRWNSRKQAIGLIREEEKEEDVVKTFDNEAIGEILVH